MSKVFVKLFKLDQFNRLSAFYVSPEHVLAVGEEIPVTACNKNMSETWPGNACAVWLVAREHSFECYGTAAEIMQRVEAALCEREAVIGAEFGAGAAATAIELGPSRFVSNGQAVDPQTGEGI